jgi:hypothetical protein
LPPHQRSAKKFGEMKMVNTAFFFVVLLLFACPCDGQEKRSSSAVRGDEFVNSVTKNGTPDSLYVGFRLVNDREDVVSKDRRETVVMTAIWNEVMINGVKSHLVIWFRENSPGFGIVATYHTPRQQGLKVVKSVAD